MTQSHSNPYGAQDAAGQSNQPASSSGQPKDGGYSQPAYYDTAAPSDQIFDQASGTGTGATSAPSSASSPYQSTPAYDPPVYDPAPATPASTTPTKDAAPGASQKAKDTASTAKDEASNVTQSAAEAGQHVADVAKDQAGNVASEAASQAKDLLSQGRNEITSQVSTQQQRIVAGLNSLAGELHSMATSSDTPGPAKDLARQAGDRTGQVATWLDGRQPNEVLQELQTFARQRPAVFLAGAAVLGLAGGRLTRGLVAAHSDETAHAAPVTPAVPASPAATVPSSTYGDVAVTPPAASGSYYGDQAQ